MGGRCSILWMIKGSAMMIPLNLMSRARELMGRRVVRSALVIIPLAMAAPVHANTTFVLGTNTLTSNRFSGGAFGHVGSSLVNGQTVDLTGDTNTGNTQVSYLTDESAFGSSSRTVSTGPNSITSTIEYTWTGSFAPGGGRLGPTDGLSLAANIATNLLPNAGQGTVSWSLDASVSNYWGRVLAGGSLLSTDSGNSLFVPFASGRADSWQVTLDVEWTFPTSTDSNGVGGAAYPQDALDARSDIGMSIVASPGTSVATTPLPATVWSGGTLLGVLALGAFFRKPRAGQHA
jgi:hypothetical protein